MHGSRKRNLCHPRLAAQTSMLCRMAYIHRFTQLVAKIVVIPTEAQAKPSAVEGPCVSEYERELTLQIP